MAGVEFAKYTIEQMGEMEVHFDNDIRAVANHSNVDIDTTQVGENTYLGGFGSYSEMLDAMREKINYADENHPNKRKSSRRKECFTLEVPCPPEIEAAGLDQEFFEAVFEMYSKYMPGLVGGQIHRDEKHMYRDPATGEMVESRIHAHLFGACITDDGRCHTSDFITPELCQRVNDDIQKMCLERWGISYQTGEGRKGKNRKSVEQLKNETSLANEIIIAKNDIAEMTETKNAIADEIEFANEELTSARAIKNNAVNEAKMAQKRRDEAEAAAAAAIAKEATAKKNLVPLRIEEKRLKRNLERYAALAADDAGMFNKTGHLSDSQKSICGFVFMDYLESVVAGEKITGRDGDNVFVEDGAAEEAAALLKAIEADPAIKAFAIASFEKFADGKCFTEYAERRNERIYAAAERVFAKMRWTFATTISKFASIARDIVDAIRQGGEEYER